MTSVNPITTLFVDVGGVLLTNGWDREARKLAAETFKLNYSEMDERHHLTFDTYEVGKLSLEEYLKRTVFYQPRAFTIEKFIEFMYSCSKPHQEMIDLIRNLKTQHDLKVAVVSNEGRELTEHRIKTFKLSEFVDFFIVSCFANMRKPDIGIYRLALDVAQVAPKKVAYIEDRPLFVEVANSLGIKGICHRDFENTRETLHKLFGMEKGASA